MISLVPTLFEVTFSAFTLTPLSCVCVFVICFHDSMSLPQFSILFLYFSAPLGINSQALHGWASKVKVLCLASLRLLSSTAILPMQSSRTLSKNVFSDMLSPNQLRCIHIQSQLLYLSQKVIGIQTMHCTLGSWLSAVYMAQSYIAGEKVHTLWSRSLSFRLSPVPSSNIHAHTGMPNDVWILIFVLPGPDQSEGGQSFASFFNQRITPVSFFICIALLPLSRSFGQRYANCTGKTKLFRARCVQGALLAKLCAMKMKYNCIKENFSSKVSCQIKNNNGVFMTITFIRWPLLGIDSVEKIRRKSICLTTERQLSLNKCIPPLRW